jgi:hypothetical protein
MKKLLGDVKLINIGSKLERKINLDVFGNLKQAEIKQTVVELATRKKQELPVVIALSSLDVCVDYEKSFENTFILGNGTIEEQLSCL